MRTILPLICAALILTACGGLARKGGYYQDDGPPARSRVDVATIADAIPRQEPLSEQGNQPYVVNSNTYYPLIDASGYRERGVASWYGKKFHGKRTSSGERYDMYAMTAAHKTLPLPTYVGVRNLSNGRSVIVRVNDRGPFIQNRLIDLSYAAAAKLGIVRTGTGIVEVQAIDVDDPDPVATEPARTQMNEKVQAPAPRLYLQVGAFISWENAANLRSRLKDAHFGPINIYSDLKNNVWFYRVRVGPLENVEESDRLVQRAAEYGIPDAHIIIE